MSAHERVIAELRGRAERCGLVGQHDRADDLLAAAVALETLPAEAERLTAEAERWKARYTDNAAQAVAAMAIRDELRAEVERLRDALRCEVTNGQATVESLATLLGHVGEPHLDAAIERLAEARRERDGLRAVVEAVRSLSVLRVTCEHAGVWRVHLRESEWDALAAALAAVRDA